MEVPLTVVLQQPFLSCYRVDCHSIKHNLRVQSGRQCYQPDVGRLRINAGGFPTGGSGSDHPWSARLVTDTVEHVR